MNVNLSAELVYQQAQLAIEQANLQAQMQQIHHRMGAIAMLEKLLKEVEPVGDKPPAD